MRSLLEVDIQQRASRTAMQMPLRCQAWIRAQQRPQGPQQLRAERRLAAAQIQARPEGTAGVEAGITTPQRHPAEQHLRTGLKLKAKLTVHQQGQRRLAGQAQPQDAAL